MAKKKVKKEKTIKTSIEMQVLKLTCEAKAQAEEIYNIRKLVGTINKAVMAGSSIIAVTERIDRIVAALDKSKSVRGL